jgi:uncharacterized protein
MAEKDTSNRGFGGMDEDRQKEIASKGGHASHEKGTAHEFTSEEAREAGRKGGQVAHEEGKAHQFSSEEARKAGHVGGQHSHGTNRSDDNENKSDRQGSGTRGGTSEQHAQAGRQSHKNS